jgi:DNA-directed RNA polymerase specialized sigma24 family protein
MEIIVPTGREAFLLSDVYHTYQRWVLYQSLVYTECLADAEDIMHDVFAQLLEQRDRYCLVHQWEKLLAALVRHYYFKRLALKRRRRVPVKLCVDETAACEQKEQQYWTRRAIRYLPRKQRLIAALHFQYHFEEEEIAAVVSITAASVKAHLKVAQARIVRYLQVHAVLERNSSLAV